MDKRDNKPRQQPQNWQREKGGVMNQTGEYFEEVAEEMGLQAADQSEKGTKKKKKK